MFLYAFKRAFQTRRIWTLSLILLIGLSISTYEIVAPLTNSISDQLDSYSRYASGFVIVWGGGSFDISYGLNFSSLHSIEQTPFDEGDISDIYEIEGVKAIYRTLITSTNYQLTEEQQRRLREEFPYHIGNATNILLDVALIGIELESTRAGLLPYSNIERGRFLEETDRGMVVVSNLLEKDFGFTIETEVSVPILGVEHSFRVVGIYSGLLPSGLDPGDTMIMSLDELLGYLMIPSSESRYNVLLVGIDDPSHAMRIVDVLRANYPGVQAHYEYARAQSYLELLNKNLRTSVLIQNTLQIVLAAIIVLVRVVDLSRNRMEFGIYTAVGWRENDLIFFLLCQSVIMSILGSAVGVVLVFSVGKIMLRAFGPLAVGQTSISYNIPDYQLLLHAPIIAIALSTITFLIGYLWFRRLTPLMLLEEK